MKLIPNKKEIKFSYSPYLIVVVLISFIMKFWYKWSVNDDLLFILKPIDKMVRVYTNTTSVYKNDSGFYNEKLNIIIDKSCSGFNFWILSFFLFSFLIFKFLQNPFYKITSIPFILICTYIFGVFVNTSRIISSISIEKTFLHLPYLHQSIGIINNLIFLILTYYFIEYYFNKHTNYEKLA